jgi:hypothetical protein
MTIPGDPTELISRAMINCVGRGTPAGSSPVSVSLVVGRLSRAYMRPAIGAGAVAGCCYVLEGGP